MHSSKRSTGSLHLSNMPSQQRYELTQLLSDQELYEHVSQVLPNLRAVSATQSFYGPNWKEKSTRRNVEIHEYDNFASTSLYNRPRAVSSIPTMRSWPWTRSHSMRSHGSAASLNFQPGYGVTWPHPNAGVPYAAVAQCNISCHLDEVLDMLFSNEPMQHEASMRALWGDKLKRGEQLRSEVFKRDLRATAPSDNASWQTDEDMDETAPPGWIAVNSTVVAPKHGINLAGKHDRTQRLCFSAYTQKSTAKNEAVFMMKTLPKNIHDQLVEASDRSALRGGVDHIAVGYHLTGSYNNIAGHQTRLVMCAYVSTFSGSERPEVMQWRAGLHDASDRANSDAKHVVMTLAKAARDFEKVIRRRRFGQQPFIYMMSEKESLVETNCGICEKDFGLLRRMHFCQLCGNLVCRRCSRKYEVEPQSGSVRKNRVCYTCASRVEHREFRPHASLNENKSTASTWYETIEEADDDDDDDHFQMQSKRQKFDRTLVLPVDALESPRPGHQLAEALFSPHPLDRARALEVLKKAVKQVTEEKDDLNKPLDPVLVGKYLEARQRLTTISSGDFAIDDGDSARSIPVFYRQSFDSGRSVFTDKEQRFVEIPAAVEHDAPISDSDGLDAICEVAAQRMQCPMAFVSVLGHDEQHIVGAFQVPECSYHLPRNQSIRSSGLIFNGKPLVVKNPMQDVRFRQMTMIHKAGVQFFAGFPVRDQYGAVVASLCTLDTRSHDGISHDDISAMTALTKLAADALNEEDETPVPFTPRSCY